ncbi:hypothetical protein BDF19DRAFT_436130 [Syncephalis fuscata]|nr:hypothetical protein BDF19DRAFT_436130 [Syncephalis fuscata]
MNLAHQSTHHSHSHSRNNNGLRLPIATHDLLAVTMTSQSSFSPLLTLSPPTKRRRRQSSMPTLSKPRRVGGPALGCRVNSTLTLVPETAALTNTRGMAPMPSHRHTKSGSNAGHSTPMSLVIYAYGGFHQYSDEVYGDLHRLTLDPLCWEPLMVRSDVDHGSVRHQHAIDDTLMDNDLPARYDHTTLLWRDRVLVVFGGHDLDGHALSDTLLIDLNTHPEGDSIARWRFAECHGSLPMGRAKHAAAIIDDILYVSGGYRHANGTASVLGDLCRLNLLTGEWLEPVVFTARYSHQLLVCDDGRLLAYGGYNSEMEALSELAFFDPSISSISYVAEEALVDDQLSISPEQQQQHQQHQQQQQQNHHQQQQQQQQITRVFVQGDQAPGKSGQHFAGIFGDRLVVLVTRCVSSGHSDLVGLWSLDLPRLVWRRHAEADELAEQLAAGSWHYAVPSHEGDRWWLFGAAENTDAEEYLGTVVELDLREHGVLPMPPSDIGDNLISMLNDARFADFTITALDTSAIGESSDEDMMGQIVSFRVHRCIIASRWPHFANMLASDTLEATQGELHLPEPARVVQAFLRYLYSDTLEVTSTTATATMVSSSTHIIDSNAVKNATTHSSISDSNDDITARLLVLANLYCLPRLQRLCCQRLHDTLNTENAASIWQHARAAGEHGLSRRVTRFIFEHFGVVCQTVGFRRLHPNDLAYLWDHVPTDARICVEVNL